MRITKLAGAGLGAVLGILAAVTVVSAQDAAANYPNKPIRVIVPFAAGGGNDIFEFFTGSANGATVADFDRSEGDVLVFSGFGTEAQGATFTQLGTTDQWQIHSGLDTHNETITFSNHAAHNAGDFFFV